MAPAKRAEWIDPLGLISGTREGARFRLFLLSDNRITRRSVADEGEGQGVGQAVELYAEEVLHIHRPGGVIGDCVKAVEFTREGVLLDKKI
jgi:hypothetical protein